MRTRSIFSSSGLPSSVALVAAVAAGCGAGPSDAAKSTAAPVTATPAVTPAGTSGTVFTPMGPRNASLVYEVPNGASVESDGRVTLNGDVLAKVDALATPQGPANATPPTDHNPAVANWVAYTWANVPSGGAGYFNSIDADFTVPTPPRSSASQDGSIVYLFPSVENSDSIVQPVLQYGAGPAGGGDYWGVANWLCYAAGSGTPCPHSTLMRVNPGDHITTSTTMTGLSTTSQTWVVTATDVTTGTQVTTTFNPDTNPFTSAQSGVLEAYGLQNCEDYPDTSEMSFFNVSVTKAGSSWSDYVAVTPTWTANTISAASEAAQGYPSTCGFNAWVSPTGPGAGLAWLDWEAPEPAMASVSRKPNQLDTFIRGTDGLIYHQAWDGSESDVPTSWESLGGSSVGTPSVVSWGANRLDTFIRGNDGAIYHKAWDGSSWQPSQTDWENLGGYVASHPVVTTWGANRLDVFDIGSDGGAWHKFWDGSADWKPSRTGYESLGGNFQGSLQAFSWGANRLDVFGVGTDGNLYHKVWDGSTWTPPRTAGWTQIGGSIVGTPAVTSWGANRLDVFWTDSDAILHHKALNGPGADNWVPSGTDSENFGGGIVGSPAAVSTAPNTIDVFIIGTDTKLYHKNWNGSVWSPTTGFEGRGGAFVASPTVASWGPGRLDVFAPGTDYQVYHLAESASGWLPPVAGNFDGLGGPLSW
jgi:hypothetical protein